eukprot:6209773-Pleurochrysis_carterae.AAC.1
MIGTLMPGVPEDKNTCKRRDRHSPVRSHVTQVSAASPHLWRAVVLVVAKTSAGRAQDLRDRAVGRIAISLRSRSPDADRAIPRGRDVLPLLGNCRACRKDFRERNGENKPTRQEMPR